MAEPLKNYFNQHFVAPFSEVCKKHIANFNQEKFLATVFDSNWKNLELKPRIKHIAFALHEQLGSEIPKNLTCIVGLAEDIRINQNKQDTFEYLILADYVEVYGLEHFKESLQAIEKITVLATCEFAIRPFLLKYPEQTFEQLYKWSTHPHASVRRLASEGCRPRLPWGMGLAPLKKDASSIYPILETLKDDPSLYVRRSVANNINDISKDHPEAILKLLKSWNGFSEERNWLVKHAARTLLKQGNTQALALFGYGDFDNFKVTNFQFLTKTVQIGNAAEFSFSLQNKNSKAQKIRLEYFVHFLLANGKPSKKIFKISEREIAAKTTLDYLKKHSFKIITTRKYYPGTHSISLVVNGVELETLDFELAE
ncbi:DNA alkylation repair protein [Flavicella sediminum]|uniref:DNA alkylation repair protein n=1 Tax=Flavicella sediminum TaxID=2585141 RepID=UPI0011226542|nr:DNA alkylation repair protein [Flavicella sediminum]